MSTIIQFLLVFLLSTVKFVVGVPSAFAAFGFGFFELSAFGIAAGITGVSIFMFFSDWLFKMWDTFRQRFLPKKAPKPHKIFSRKSRSYVKIIRKYGLPGIAFITPTIISIPVGTLLARRLYPNRKKVFLYLSISVILWSLTLSAILHFPSLLSKP
ncbi:MAG: hypothetical protein RLZZ543_1004 [Bacteroidota bacterium]|jgi:hypothetical protein